MASEAPDDRCCDQCGRWVEPNELLYRLRVELVAEPGPVDLSAPQEIGDVQSELDALIRKLEGMTEDQVSEATSQIHERFDFNLCPKCRADIRAQMKNRLTIFNSHTLDS
jgi:hypothetical protein